MGNLMKNILKIIINKILKKNMDFGTDEYQSTRQRHNLINWLEKENRKITLWKK
jgi:hypothetical protein